jgi:hypothetical protein
MSASEQRNIDQAWIACSEEELERHARLSSAEDFTIVEAALLFTGRDPVFWGAPSERILVSRKRAQKHFGKATALYKELLGQLAAKELRPTLSEFNGDGSYDGERTRISRGELERFRATCDIDTVPLPGTPEPQADTLDRQGKRTEAMRHARGTRLAILEHWPEIVARFGPSANGEQVARILKTHIDPSERRPERKTIQNRLAELRREGLIP